MISIVGDVEQKGMLTSFLETAIKSLPEHNGIFYRGFPIISTYDGGVKLDGLFCSERYGVVIVHIFEEDTIDHAFMDMVDQVHLKLISILSDVKSLSEKRRLIVPIRTIIYSPRIVESVEIDEEDLFLINNDPDFITCLENEVWDRPDLLKAVLSRIQSLSGIRGGKKRTNLSRPDSLGATLKKLESDLATLDINQTRAVLENVDTVQRIRGLAGSGKTIVLARKIAHLHAQHPEWNIAVTFNTRALKEQFRRLIDIFYRDAMGAAPDFTKVNIIHAWGSPSNIGVYYLACAGNDIKYHDFSAAKELAEHGVTPFQAVCKLWMESKVESKKLFDLILIDEAQDFTPEFLQLCYNLLGDEKRLVYAYDELQNLGDSAMPSPDEIWGRNENGDPVVKFDNAAQDIILNVCYRNPGPTLTTAHALGFGIYRSPMVQMFDYSELWREIGYEVQSGELVDGKNVILSRTDKSSPLLLSSHNNNSDIIQFHRFNSLTEESDWIASQIQKNLYEDELLPSDIMVIHLDAMVMRNSVGYIRSKLFELGVNTSIAGVTSSPDEFYTDDSVTFTSIYRAKGNEAAMVYIMGGEWSNQPFELAKRRSILFTAMTRSKAWLRVCGIGPYFDGLIDEYNSVMKNGFSLNFTYPTQDERKKMRVVNRDMTSEEQRRVLIAKRKAEDLTNLLVASGISAHDIPDEIREQLIKALRGE